MFELQSKYTGYEPISNDEEALFPPAPRKASNLNAWSVASALLVVAGTTVLLSTVSIPSTGIKPSFNAAGSINFGFKRVNYDALPYFDKTSDDLLKYKFLSKYVALVEPHAEMEFYMYESTEYDVEYSVCDKSHSCTTGTWFAKDKKSTKSIKFDCLAYDTLSVEIKQYDSSKNLVDSVSGDAVCLYVRREMRKLTSEDLDKFISASAKLNAISDAEGQGVYGQKYLSASSLVKYHHFNAVQQNQDHIHEGNGFTIQHVKLTNIFEASVQAVDPSIAMPYWDFTIDSSEGLTTNVATIFTDKMYGQNYQPTDVSGWTYKDDLIENGRIMNGLWKDLKVEMNPYPGSPYEFGYGYMRAPWNMNPSPYLSRYTHIETESNAGYSYMPTCSNHYDILQYDDQMDFYYMVSYAPHGTLHILEGGFYGCDLLQPLVDAGYITDYNAVCYFWVFTLKELYRAGAITPNTGCTPAENLQDSYCGYKITDSSSFYPTLRGMLQAGLNLTMEGLEEAFMDFVQNDGSKIFPGDHLESASPADPSFWVIHPTLERLLHAKLLAGGFEGDGEWPTSTKKDYICSKSTCYENGKKSSYSDCCYGHYQDDQLYDGLAGSTKAYFGPTNREVEAATDSTSMDYSMSYIYDNFEWDHCEEDFQTLLQDMYDDMQAVESGDMTAVRKVPRPASQDAARARKEQIVKNGNAYEASL